MLELSGCCDLSPVSVFSEIRELVEKQTDLPGIHVRRKVSVSKPGLMLLLEQNTSCLLFWHVVNTSGTPI